ncbi:uncharacterized protein LOC108906332 isoform X2 [Anoplophora glabripennis]|uniref:uncharacterized protein LOC108906332 isoform X2 n=1 Tax=Anoplophora glabripennis TaxID=217634 RepID=UPI0008736799|nr:uncharacterized protein LOC108906332 isoform X2 [Anoplophora glabripennis]
MDQHKFVSIIRQFPQIWERNHPKFRDKDAKDCAWEMIGSKMGCTDPNIVPRKQSTNNDEDMQKAEELCSQINFDASFISVNQTDFDKALIELVRKTTPIWDRNCNTYPNKQLKNQLWQNIASKLKRDINLCMLRWKALREKYIRQKTKYQQEGDVKWELLDEMGFLDKVIQYRKKQSDSNTDQKRSTCVNFYPKERKQNESSQDSNSSFSQNAYCCEMEDDTLMNDSSNDYHAIIKQECTVLQKADSSFHSENNGASRKRCISVNSEASAEKLSKNEDTEIKEKSPEQLFGDLVAVLLSKKPEKYRNIYMIEIMQVLSK